MMTNNDFRESLRRAGLTQQRFADLVDVDRSAVKRWCSSTAKYSRRPPAAAALLLCAINAGLVTETWITQTKKYWAVDPAGQ